jgi:hypothetical protein
VHRSLVRWAVTVGGALPTLALASPAGASVTFGSDLSLPPIPPPARECNPGTGQSCTNVATSFHAGNALPIRAPMSGVITEVRYRTNTPDTATLRLAHLETNGDATGAGTGPTATLSGSGAVESVPARLPVQQGDYLAGDGVSTTQYNCDDLGGSFTIYLPPLADGAALRPFSFVQQQCEVLVQAVIEADNDADALGDETQDADDDNDAVADASDNCPLVANVAQADADGDGAGDACDLTPDPPADPPPGAPGGPSGLPRTLADLPPPAVGRLANVAPVKGEVLIALPAGASAARAHAGQKGLTFVPLTEARQIPVGSFLDTSRGTVQLVSATGAADKTQSGQFTAGIFQVLQSRRKRDKGLTELRLKGGSFGRCAAARGKRASAAGLSKRTIRTLRSKAKGRFRTRGRHSAATVRGTVWITADRCDGTLTTVRRGTVAVRDFRRKRTVLVRAGKSYLARAKAGSRRRR